MELNLPKDAEGNAIPLNVTTMYKKDGAQVRVDDLVHGVISNSWCVFSGYEKLAPSSLYLNKPDSWEKLLEDLDRGAKKWDYGACGYFGKAGVSACSSCIANKNESCERAVYANIASRIRKLRGED